MWATRYSWASRSFIDVKAMGESIDAIYDSSSGSLSQLVNEPIRI